MIPWDEHSDKVSKQRPDLEKAKSLTKIADLEDGEGGKDRTAAFHACRRGIL